jgi:RHS repeat-associated protein
MISGAGRMMIYDSENRPTSITVGSATTMVYDYSGERVKKTASGVTTTYIGNLVECAGSCTKFYFAGGTRIALKDSGGSVYYYHSDHLGSSTVVTNSSGGLYQTLQYYPYGRTRVNSLCGGSGEGCASGVKHKYTSQEQDSSTAIGTDVSTSLYYYRARYYDPVIGRFISADSLTFRSPQKLNRYSYVLNNPIRYIDPSGHTAMINQSMMSGGVSTSLSFGAGGGPSGFSGQATGAGLYTFTSWGAGSNSGSFPDPSLTNPPGMATAFPTGVNPGLMGPSKYQGISLSTSNIRTVQSSIPGDPGGSSLTTTTGMVSGNAAFAQYYRQYGSTFSAGDIAQMTWDRSRFWDVELTKIV